MISLEDCQNIAHAVDGAHRGEERLRTACTEADITRRTLQRWNRGSGLDRGDRQLQVVRHVPAHALSEAERDEILLIAITSRTAELSAARIVSMLANEGVYVACESSFSRVPRAQGQPRRRGRAKVPQRNPPPTTHGATAPRQVFCRAMTYLLVTVIGRWLYLYLILDLYSPKIVGFEVRETDDSEHAVNLLRRTALAEGLHKQDYKRVLHGENGATLKATTVLAKMYCLGLKASCSHPRVRDGNAFVEALFRAAQYRPQFPTNGFADLDQVRGRACSSVGITTIIATVASAMSTRRRDTRAKIGSCYALAMRSTSGHGRNARGAGHGTPDPGIRHSGHAQFRARCNDQRGDRYPS